MREDGVKQCKVSKVPKFQSWDVKTVLAVVSQTRDFFSVILSLSSVFESLKL